MYSFYRNSEGTLYGEWTSKGGFVELPWNSSRLFNPLLEFQRNSVWGNGPQKEGLWNSPGIPLVVHFKRRTSSYGGVEEYSLTGVAE